MRKTRVSAAAMLAPAALAVSLVLVLPLGLMFRYSLNRFEPGRFMVEALTLENYVKLVSDAYYLGVLRSTVLMALAVTAACLALGFPLALAIARASPRVKAVLIVLVVVPLFVGNAVRAAGWMVAFGQKGVINALLELMAPTWAPLTIMYTPGAVFVGIIAVNLPFVVLTLQSVLEGIDRSSEEAALRYGATPTTFWRLVTLPLAIPWVLAAAVLCFILTMNAYATPVLLGGPRFQMMAPVVANEVLNQNNWPFGAALSFMLMIVTLLLTVIANVVVIRRYTR